MLNLPAFGPDYYEMFAAMWFALLLGKASKQQTTILMTCLVGAVLTGSWVGVFVGAILPFTLFPLDILRKVGR